jgi:hypothetical protein
VLVLNGNQAVVGDEGEVGQNRARGHDLRAGHDDARVGFFLYVDADIGHLIGRPIAIHRRMNDRVIDEGDAFLAVAIPAARVLLVRRIEVGIRAERCQE